MIMFSENCLVIPNGIIIFAPNNRNMRVFFFYDMVQIKTEKQYKAACDRINELLKIVSNDTPADDKNMLELDLISDLVADYEEEHYPIAAPI